MNAKQYADKRFPIHPTFNKIAKEAFNAGMESAKPCDVKKLEEELKATKKELKELWDTLHDSEKCGELLAGL